MTQQELEKSSISLEIDGIDLDISTISRSGDRDPIVFLHGFGSTKEDYADIVRQAALIDYPFLAYDAPGCGETSCSNLKEVSIPFLVKTALAMLDRMQIGRFHLVGHSMGGLTALMLAHQHQNRVLSFTDIEGNIAPEDCFLSRQIIEYPAENAEKFFDQFIKRTLHTPAYSSPLYSASLRHKVRAEAVKGIFSSMVQLSDHGELILANGYSHKCPACYKSNSKFQHL